MVGLYMNVIIISYQNLEGNYNFFWYVCVTEFIISYQNLEGNYNLISDMGQFYSLYHIKT